MDEHANWDWGNESATRAKREDNGIGDMRIGEYIADGESSISGTKPTLAFKLIYASVSGKPQFTNDELRQIYYGEPPSV